MGLDGLALHEVGKVGMVPKENEARSVKGSYNGDVMGGKMEDDEKEAEVLKDMEEKKRAPSICSCQELSFYHSRNLHANTSLERKKK